MLPIDFQTGQLTFKRNSAFNTLEQRQIPQRVENTKPDLLT